MLRARFGESFAAGLAGVQAATGNRRNELESLAFAAPAVSAQGQRHSFLYSTTGWPRSNKRIGEHGAENGFSRQPRRVWPPNIHKEIAKRRNLINIFPGNLGEIKAIATRTRMSGTSLEAMSGTVHNHKSPVSLARPYGVWARDTWLFMPPPPLPTLRPPRSRATGRRPGEGALSEQAADRGCGAQCRRLPQAPPRPRRLGR